MEFDELLERLDDLIVQAEADGFLLFAHALRAAQARARGSYALFSTRDRVYVESLKSKQRERARRDGPDPRD